MQKYPKHKRICNCSIPTDKNIFKKETDYSFCKRCGSIMIKNTNGDINYTIKPKHKQGSTEINPIDIIKSMIDRTNTYYPNLNNEYNMDKEEMINTKKSNKFIDLYLDNRKVILLYLQKLMKIFDYTDIIFYQSLYYMDYIFSHKITAEMDEKEILFYLIGYFLCSTKTRESDIIEPQLINFLQIKQNIFLSIKKIVYYEVLCLKSINYNIFSYSAYDWLIQLIGVGIVFDCEIDSENQYIVINGHRHTILNTINKYALKILLNLTKNKIFMKYSPMYISFSLLQISREKFLDPNLMKVDLYNKLINLYGINIDDYKKCYDEIKIIMEKNIFENDELKIGKNNYQNGRNNKSLKSKIIKQFSVENKFISEIHKLKKSFGIKINKSSKNLEINNFQDENNYKQNEIIDNVNKNKINNKYDEVKILNEENIQNNKLKIMKNNIGSKGYQNITKFSNDFNNKSMKKNDSLPLIKSSIKIMIEPIKYKNRRIFPNSSKTLLYYNKDLSTKYNDSPENNSIINLYKAINENKNYISLYKKNNIKKSLFSLKNNNKKMLKIKKASKPASFEEKSKIGNNYIEKSTLKDNENYTRKKGSLFSLFKMRNQNTDLFQ